MDKNRVYTQNNLLDLCDSVCEKVTTLRENVQSLERLFKQLGTMRDSSFLRLEINQIRNKINDGLACVTADIKILKSAKGPEMKVIELRTGTIEEFILDTLEKYNALLKKITAKERECILTTISSSSDVYRPVSTRSSSNLQRASHMLTHIKLEEQNLLMKQQRILDMHTQIADTKEIMVLLSNIVQEQKDSVDRVTELIEEVTVDIETGNKELEKAEMKEVKSRKKKLWILVILIIIVSIIVVALCFI